MLPALLAKKSKFCRENRELLLLRKFVIANVGQEGIRSNFILKEMGAVPNVVINSVRN